ncbi:ABC transporter permease subunit [Bacillus salitolerans]|uniref:ABC transporter permease subunit n=1 Tax=Bacillus salitolerans TaxID=1437434 RepID=A0ABW4LUD8_9BACI
MIHYFIKKPKFIISFSFILLLLLASLGYEFLYGGYIWENVSREDASGALIGPPYTPSQNPPFGTDRVSTPILAKIIQGAKYTIFTALFISLLQVCIGFLVSIFFSRLPKLIQRTFEGIVESSLYIPITIIAYMVIFPLQYYLDPNEDFANFYKLYGLQVSILTLLGIPQLVLLFTKDIQQNLKEEYILASKTLGAQGFRLFRTHIIPYMIPRLILQFSQRTVEVLILLAHLGFLAVFLGGYVMKEVYDGEMQAFSLSNEWAGEIGKSFRDLMLTPWIIYFPLMFFALTVMSFNMITTSIREYIQSPSIMKKKNRNGVHSQHSDYHSVSEEEEFTFIEKKTANLNKRRKRPV